MAKYYSGEPVKSFYTATPGCTLWCPNCGKPVQGGQQVVGRDVHKCGEYDYTEIVHAHCYTGPKPVVVEFVPPTTPTEAVMGGGVRIDGMTVEQWLAKRGR